MDRRGFLGRSALVTGALAVPGAMALPGCGGVIRPELAAQDASELLARLDRGLGAVRSVPVGAMASAMPWQVRPQLSENVLRLTLEAFVVADVAGSIPEGATLPRTVRERLGPELGVLDLSREVSHALLARMPPAVRRRISRDARGRPDIGMNVAEWLDTHANEIGITATSRMRLRRVATNLTTQMRRQSASRVIDDCIVKAERVASVRPAIAPARALATAAIVDALWQDVEGVPGSTSGSRTAAPEGVYVQPADEAEALGSGSGVPRWSERWARPGDEEIEIGAIMMPFGLLTCGALLIAGLIVLIAGCVQNGDWDGTPQSMGG